MGQERDKKILLPNSVPTQRELENSKKNSQKIKKVNSGIISIQIGLRVAKKEGKKILSRIPFILDPGKKIPKTKPKKFKKLINLILALFLAKTGWDRLRKREKKLSPEFRSYLARGRKF